MVITGSATCRGQLAFSTHSQMAVGVESAFYGRRTANSRTVDTTCLLLELLCKSQGKVSYLSRSLAGVA
jgi:hypothetical protein